MESEDEPLNDLFQVISLSELVFGFELIRFEENVVTFYYSVHNIHFTSELHLPLSIPSHSSSSSLSNVLFSIGMAILPWYWMGFGTKIIRIKKEVGSFSREMMDYWEDFYNNIMLEYMYINHIAIQIRVECESIHESDEILELFPPCSTLNVPQILIPIGGFFSSSFYLFHNPCLLTLLVLLGGKDSLVVWEEVLQKGVLSPLLLHIADGLTEFESNARLLSLLTLTACPFYIGKKIMT